ncbi:MAG: DNA translocase FtsK 4TM domain-containing protein, partial [Verrucomicrobiota bacterium]
MRKKKEQKTEIKLIHELVAITLLGIGALLLLALISFEPDDVPLFAAQSGGKIDNFIGPAGAWIAGGLVLLFGVAAYLVPLVMILGGVGLIFAIRVDYRMKLLWFSLIIVCGAGLLQLLDGVVRPIEGVDWPGGIVGYGVHDKFLASIIGRAGSAIVLSLIYASSLILLFEVRPIELVRRSWKFAVKWYEEREKRRFEEADPLERLELKQKQIEKERKKLERKLTRKARKDEDDEFPEEPVARAIPEEESANEAPIRPEPKVIDTMASREEPGEVSIAAEPEEELNTGVGQSKSRATQTKGGGSSEKDFVVSEDRPIIKDYEMPEIELLEANTNKGGGGMDEDELKSQQQLLVDTLKQFGIEVEPGDITKGATITRYEVYPAPGVRVERIAKMNKDIARAMRAESINILAPIPGKDTVGIEVGNADKAMIVLRDLFETDAWRRSKSKIPLALGKDVYGKVLIADLAEMPHLLIGGSTGSGKSVCINSILMSFLYKFSPDDLR